MNKKAIKVIKRGSTAIAAIRETEGSSEPKPAATISEEKTERRLHRKMADTVSNWIAERRKNKSVEETAAIRNLFGGDALMGKTA